MTGGMLACRAVPERVCLAVQIWTIDEGYAFDNMYVGNDPEEAARLREAVWKPKHAALVGGGSGFLCEARRNAAPTVQPTRCRACHSCRERHIISHVNQPLLGLPGSSITTE
jgi:hypothetical protein